MSKFFYYEMLFSDAHAESSPTSIFNFEYRILRRTIIDDPSLHCTNTLSFHFKFRNNLIFDFSLENCNIFSVSLELGAQKLVLVFIIES